MNVNTVKLQMPGKELAALVTEEQSMFIKESMQKVEYESYCLESLSQACENFCLIVNDKSQQYNTVMDVLNSLVNRVLARKELNMRLINEESVDSLMELLKVLPTKDFEFLFLADLLQSIRTVLNSPEDYERRQLEFLVLRLTEGLRYHILPYLIETGIQGLDTSQLTPKLTFIAQLLMLVQAMQQVDQLLQRRYKSSSFLEHFTDHHFQ